jgi:UDP-glucose 4-epimerase
MKKNCILVTGGAGFIGSQVNKQLHQAGYSTVILDNLSCGNRGSVTKGHFIQGDIGDGLLLKKIFCDFPIDIVMHFAAFHDVGESVKYPLKYYDNNVAKSIKLLESMIENNVKKMIFSSSAAIFGYPLEIPLKESHPTQPINPYGCSKLMVEKILQDLDRAYGLKFCSLRYFNAAGGDPDGEIKNYKMRDSNLIPLALRSLTESKRSLTVFGTDYPTQDGTCVRDYIHIYDLAEAHIAAMQQLLAGNPSSQYNLGNGQGFSVREVLHTIENVTGKSLDIIVGERRPGDAPVLIADSSKAHRELHWKPKFPDLPTIIEHAWKAIHN